MGIGTLIAIFLSCLCLYLFFALIEFLYRIWWKPIQIQNMLRAQGIRGPSYKFLHGNTIDVYKMRRESMMKPLELSDNILAGVQPHIHSWINLYGRNYLSWHGSTAQLIVTEPDLMKEILNNKNGDFVKTKTVGFLLKLLGDGLVTSEGKKWVRQRKLANPAFHAENLKRMIPAMLISVEIMLERWRHFEGKEVEIFEEFKVATADVISKTAFGSNYLEGAKVFENLSKLVAMAAGNANRIKLPIIGKLVKTFDEIESEKVENGIRESFIQMIRRREEKMKMGEPDEHDCDYLGFLVRANQDADDNKRISIEDVIDECKTFYFAGHETTTSLLTWSVLLLAIHTDWQDKARKEVMEIFKGKNPNPDYNGIVKLKTMTMIINETLRLYPPNVAITRMVTKQTRLGDLLLPGNIEILIPCLVSHNDPEIWGEDVCLFKPDRFAEGLTKAAKNTTAYVPFGLGPRACIGINFAMIEVKLSLSMILQRYAFTLSPTYVHSPIQHLTSRPQHGVQIILHAL
ncbi:hypothetical protein GIB67_036752 [Kingdonia uniflora]|uniref:Cytochrome P450 n=1 Tax=Kingdonia uniflora TaxID=39325 RepID=A0A7J7LWL4_9MAGN|nr:hypothetical protein GIB67_036752 [Kingdonia uniflora]